MEPATEPLEESPTSPDRRTVPAPRPGSGRRAALGAALLAALLAIACAPDAPRPNVLLVTLDTTRADRLGAYGHAAATTPTLDALAARGVLFENAYTSAPMTLPAHATMMTGLLPPEHGARVNGEHRLSEGVPTLAGELSAAGYRTGAFVAAFVLDGRFGLGRGFETYDDDLTDALEQEVPSALARYRPGNRVVDAALAWLEGADDGRPFFAWVHLYDAHYPWHAHDGDATTAGEAGTYDGELAFVDRQVGRLTGWLEARGLAATTLVIAVGDHGEGLGDHGEIEHAYLLDEEVLHVPWIVAGPGVEAGRRVPALVTLADLRPTVADLLALPAPGARGRSLVPALRGGELPSEESYAETDLPWTAFRWAPQRSLTTERWAYVHSPQPELYDRASDRGELVNLVEVRPEVTADLEARLSALEATFDVRASEAAALSDADREALAALGYASGGGAGAPDDPEPLADVKERLPAKALAARFRELQAKEALAPDEALAMARELVRLSPETPAFHGHLGRALAAVGQVDEGVRELRLVVELAPGDAVAHYDLGDVLEQAGRIDPAREQFEAALELEPELAAAHVGMGNVLRAEGRPDLAAGRYTEALRLRPDYPEAHYNLALTFLDRGRPEQAAEHLRAAIEGRPGWILAHASLANLYANWGQGEQAAGAYRRALELAPERADLRVELGLVLAALGRRDEALAQYEQALATAPRFPRAHVLLGDAAAEDGRHAEARAHYEQAVAAAPDAAEPAARLARLLATCPDASLRDPARAVPLAERARDLTQAGNPRVLDTLSLAYAADGREDEALRAGSRALELARERGDAALAQEIEERLARHAAERPGEPTADR